MNTEINEFLAAKSKSGKPVLISAQAKELLNLRRLPAMLNTAQTAVMLGLADHDIPVLVRAELLKPLGNPPSNAVKCFGTVEVLEMAGESPVLNKIRSTVYQYWRGKNANNAKGARADANGRRWRCRRGIGFHICWKI
jgi:hypothetical protein